MKKTFTPFLLSTLIAFVLIGCNENKTKLLARTWKIEDVKISKDVPEEQKAFFESMLSQMKQYLRSCDLKPSVDFVEYYILYENSFIGKNNLDACFQILFSELWKTYQTCINYNDLLEEETKTINVHFRRGLNLTRSAWAYVQFIIIKLSDYFCIPFKKNFNKNLPPSKFVHFFLEKIEFQKKTWVFLGW